MQNLLNKWQTLCQHQYFYLPLVGSLLINSLIWLIIIWRVPVSSEWIPLHFNVFFGIDWIGPWLGVFVYPAVGLMIILFNLFLIFLVYVKSLLLVRILSFSSLVTQTIILFGLLILLVKFFV